MYLSVQLSWDQERRRYDWPTTRMLLLPFARQTYVCCTIIVRQNSEVRLLRASHVRVRDTYDWLVIRQFNTNLTLRSPTEPRLVKTVAHARSPNGQLWLRFYIYCSIINECLLNFFHYKVCSQNIRQNVPFMCFQCMFFRLRFTIKWDPVLFDKR